MNRVIPWLRALQLSAALVVIYLTLKLIQSQVMGTASAITRFASCSGVFGLISAVLGLWSLLSTYLDPLTPVLFDVLAGILFLAGGIASALALYGIDNCNLYDEMLHSPLLNEGSTGSGSDRRYGVVAKHDDESRVFRKLRTNCRRAQVGMTFQFISLAIVTGLLVLAYRQRKRAKAMAVGVLRYAAD
ncbi:hypothetical protein N0V88_004963 [Collariella sp. IMI 366227]|nr:hypothetical protein N0V88_004963 [Collariella sp. IMI 366227]